jgi:hypothetical protein
MENIILTQFTIGEEFALHEFELEYNETKTDKNGVDYDYYRYMGSLNSIEIKKLILAYNCDVLRGVFCFS